MVKNTNMTMDKNTVSDKASKSLLKELISNIEETRRLVPKMFVIPWSVDGQTSFAICRDTMSILFAGMSPIREIRNTMLGFLKGAVVNKYEGDQDVE
jgi:hypothetical protein